MSTYRLTSDGKYVFPKRGDPPSVIPDGYKRDPGDPYILVPDFREECKQRSCRQKILPCGKLSTVFYCEFLDVIVTPQFCNECELEVKNKEPESRRL